MRRSALETRADAEDPAVDEGLRFAMKKRLLVEPLKHGPADAVDHFASASAFVSGGSGHEAFRVDRRLLGNYPSACGYTDGESARGSCSGLDKSQVPLVVCSACDRMAFALWGR